MKIKIDENMPEALVQVLGGFGHAADTVVSEGLAGQADEPVCEAAQREGRFLITQDLDFSDTRRFEPGTHAGLLLVRLRRPSRASLTLRVERVFADEPVESWSRCFVVVTDRKVRVRRPPPPNQSIAEGSAA